MNAYDIIVFESLSTNLDLVGDFSTRSLDKVICCLVYCNLAKIAQKNKTKVKT